MIGSKVDIPSEWTNIDTNNPNVPPLLVVNAQIPSDFSATIFYSNDDGEGWSLVIYFRITQVSSNYKIILKYCKHICFIFLHIGNCNSIVRSVYCPTLSQIVCYLLPRYTCICTLKNDKINYIKNTS